MSKRRKEIEKLYDRNKLYTLEEAVSILKDCPKVKFDQSVELSLRMGVDPKKSDQQVRSTVTLPNGTGKTLRVLVLTKGDNVKKAEEAGADHVGSDELIQQIQGGWMEFDAVIATPDMMRDVGKLARILGPRGLMPTPKAGTVTTDVAKAVTELKKGKVEFKVDKSAVINNIVGKLSFESDKISENVKALYSAIQRVKPASAKGQYVKSVVLSSTMGPGIKLELNSVG